MRDIISRDVRIRGHYSAFAKKERREREMVQKPVIGLWG